MITGLNHITLAVRDVPKALSFYEDVLGADVAHVWDGGAYLTFGSLWLCLSKDTEVTDKTDYTHIALNVSTADFAQAAARIRASGAPEWKENRSEGLSLYFQDPDGHKLELHVGSLQTRLDHIAQERVAC